MKTIKLTESQMQLLSKLINEEDAPDFENGDTQEFGNTEQIGITSSLHDVDGNIKNGSAVKSMKGAEKAAIKNFPDYTGWGRTCPY